MQTPRIVIIEDEMIIAHDVKQTLVNMGYEVPLVTGSGEAALKKIKDIRPDLVLMDIMLKGRMNGIDAAAKTHDIYNIPVVYMTANADKKTIERAKKTEPYGLIYKPVKSEVLHAVIEMALYKHKMESKLIEHDAQLKATLNSIGDAVISTDKNSKIVSMNPVAEKLTGWNFNDAEGRPLTEVFNIVNALTGEKAVNPVKKVLELGTVVGLANHTKLISKDGNEYQIADSGSPIIDINGEITGVVMVFRDVT
ncbi:MAG: GGDEF domain-containing response regulator, partial [Bacteroidetes bacterium]